MTTELTFEEPPEVDPRRGAMRNWLTALREHPDRWAKYPLTWKTQGACAGTANRVLGGYLGGDPAGSFEVVTRKMAVGEYAMFARYVGEQS